MSTTTETVETPVEEAPVRPPLNEHLREFLMRKKSDQRGSHERMLKNKEELGLSVRNLAELESVQDVVEVAIDRVLTGVDPETALCVMLMQGIIIGYTFAQEEKE